MALPSQGSGSSTFSAPLLLPPSPPQGFCKGPDWPPAAVSHSLVPTTSWERPLLKSIRCWPSLAQNAAAAPTSLRQKPKAYKWPRGLTWPGLYPSLPPTTLPLVSLNQALEPFVPAAWMLASLPPPLESTHPLSEASLRVLFKVTTFPTLPNPLPYFMFFSDTLYILLIYVFSVCL